MANFVKRLAKFRFSRRLFVPLQPISETDKSEFMEIKWIDGFVIKTSVSAEHSVVIAANKEGLLSLAKQLNDLANENIGSHIHYDEYNSLEDGSCELIIEKID